MEQLLEPLESSCFTYAPTTWAAEGSNETAASEPFVFQWCHKGRATVRTKGVRTPRVRLHAGAGVVSVCVCFLNWYTIGVHYRFCHA